MMEITINIPGLKELAEAVLCTANTRGTGATVTTAAQPQPVNLAQASAIPQPPVQQPPVQPAPAVPAQQAPVQQVSIPAAPPVTQPVPTATQSYTLDDLARAAMTLMDSGRQAELQGLLKNFGVDALPVLPQEQYGAFATALRGMGAQI